MTVELVHLTDDRDASRRICDGLPFDPPRQRGAEVLTIRACPTCMRIALGRDD